MTIEKVKNELNKHLGDVVTIKYNLGRNKFEKYDVVIKELYNHVFLVEVKKIHNCYIQSFSYSDVLTKTIKIDYEKEI